MAPINHEKAKDPFYIFEYIDLFMESIRRINENTSEFTDTYDIIKGSMTPYNKNRTYDDEIKAENANKISSKYDRKRDKKPKIHTITDHYHKMNITEDINAFTPNPDEKKGTCRALALFGKCKYGNDCIYSHKPEDLNHEVEKQIKDMKNATDYTDFNTDNFLFITNQINFPFNLYL